MQRIVGDPWKALAEGKLEHFPAGSLLFRQGEVASDVFYIHSGAIKLIRSETDSRDAIVALVFACRLVGIAPAVLGEPHQVTAVTAVASELYRLRGDELHEMKGRDRLFASAVEQEMAADTFQLVEHIGRSSMDAKSRLMAVLFDLARASGTRREDGWVRLDLHVSVGDLADLVLTTREYVSRLLSSLAADGYVRREKGWLMIRPTDESLGGQRRPVVHRERRK